MQQKSNFIQIFLKTFLLCIVLASFGLIVFYGWQFYQKSYEEKIALKKDRNVEIKEALEINFSVPVWKEEYKLGVKIIPEEKVRIDFDQAKRKLTIVPEKFWRPGMNYTIILPEGRTAMLNKFSEKKLVFSSANFPQVKSIFPADGTKDVVIGAEDPIVVDFDRSTKDYFIEFELNPESELEYQNNPEKTQFKILPKNTVQDGIPYSLKISVKVAGERDEEYQVLSVGSFETLKTTPIAWEKDLTLRLAQAKKYTKAKITQGKYLDVNLETQIMTIFENGKLVDSFLISSGQRGMETPIGQTQIYNKFPRAYSKAYGLYMPYWMAIISTGKVGIHELPEWPGGYKEGANHLGIPVSHGCMRLGVGPAKTVYEFSEIGTPVIIY